ncbi:serine O-acetyltransferase [Algicola sagamiensis]|uniref:serine O-acetyltransferase n=1 Tax=Algicola sagamiensis TaxID=163869 RepID=UPI000371DA5C|nr:serine O-acetyltransferase [Algicola sagamiensis]
MDSYEQTLWDQLVDEALQLSTDEPILSSFLHSTVIRHHHIASALSFILANKLSDTVVSAISIKEIMDEAFESEPQLAQFASYDLRAVVQRDPAIEIAITVLLYLKGFHAIQTHRVANWLWRYNRKALARFLQSRNSEVFGVDIHPACRIGKGVMFDHATGIVVGETSVIEDEVSILQNVTLGGTGKECGDRHPKVRRGVLIGAGAKILGNIEIGEGVKVGANSVVLNDIAAHLTVVGVPAQVIGRPDTQMPALTMEQDVTADQPLPEQK